MATVTSAQCAISSTVTESLLTKSLGPFATELLMSGLSVGVATACTNPVDVVKVRLQVTRPDGRVLGLIGTGVDLVRTEGPVALFNGVTPAVARAVFYGGLRLGLYCPIKDALTTEGQNATITQKIAAGCISGGLAAGISNPTDLVCNPVYICAFDTVIPQVRETNLSACLVKMCSCNFIFLVKKNHAIYCIPGVVLFSLVNASLFASRAYI